MVGTAGRWLLTEVFPEPIGTVYWATLVANTLGAFLLGWFVVRRAVVAPRQATTVPFFAIGLFGSFTTFSTLMVEIVAALADGAVWGGAAYGALSIVAGLLAAVAGMRVAEAMP